MKQMIAMLVVASVSAPVLTEGVGQGDAKAVIQNAAVRVLRMTVPPHQKMPLGDHPHAIMIPLPTVPAGGHAPTPEVWWLPTTTRTIENIGDASHDVLIVELKATRPAVLASGLSILAGRGNETAFVGFTEQRKGFDIHTVMDNDHALVQAYQLAPGARDANLHPHDWQTILIHLSSNDMEGAGPGHARRQFARGDVGTIPAKVPHAFANVGGAPAEFLYVLVK
jgi:Cupin domain